MNKFKIELGRRIAEIRKKNKMTQKKLSELSNLHHTYISSLERGERNITFDNIIKITKALNIQLEDLFIKNNKTIKPRRTVPKKIKFYKLGGTWDMKISDKGLRGEGIMSDLELKEVEKNLEHNEENIMNYFNLRLEKAKSYRKDVTKHFSWIKDVKKMARGDFVPLFSGDSSHYRAALHAPIIALILQELKKKPKVPILAGIGTDTSDIFLSLMDVFLFDKNCAPVLVSGANRSINEPDSDALVNFYELMIASHMHLKPGAYYVYNHHIYNGVDFLKIDPSEHPKNLEGMMTFYAPHGTQINLNFLDAEENNGIKKKYNNRTVDTFSAKEIFDAMNQILTVNLASQNPIEDEVERILDERFPAVVIESHALGNVPFPIRRAAVRAVKKGKKVMVISRCLVGKITNRYLMALINANSNELKNCRNKILNGQKLNSLAARAIMLRSILEARHSTQIQDLIDKLSYQRNII
ncbi:MAG: helix-turn-helix domain-containing protein [Candidatus Moranbacteria bacterium]|nr:helix-turn-helix domain-containing protein [Candidatus Moranbacteria bacterium]